MEASETHLWARPAVVLAYGVCCALVAAGCAGVEEPTAGICDAGGGAPERSWGPWQETSSWASSPDDAESEPRDVQSASDALIVLYQHHLREPTPRGGGCQFQPTCSHYARQAFADHGVVGGFVLTMDRLLVREHPFAHGRYPTVCRGERPVLYDPPP